MKTEKPKKRRVLMPWMRKRKTRQLWESEFNVVKEGLDEKQVVAFVDNLIAQHRTLQQASADSLRSLLKTAVTDAEQLAASIKVKAQAEAEAEAAGIITQAKQEDQEIKRRAEIAAQKEAEDILSVANKKAEDILSVVNKKAEITEVEARQNALLFLLRAREEIEKEVREEYKRAYARLSSSLQNLLDEGQSIEVELKGKRARLWESKKFELKEHETTLLETPEEVAPPLETLAPEEEIKQPVQLQEEVSEEKTEEPAQLQEKAPVSESVEETTEEPLGQHPPEEIPSREETKSTRLKPADRQTLYVGEVELAIAIPVELKMVSKFYNYLQTIPDIKILRTTGSWDRGTTITVVADKPIPLISKISEVPDVEVIAELPQKDSSEKGKSSSRLRGGGKGVKRIKLTLKEA
jgi:cell division septum initiation protein DivIVA